MHMADDLFQSFFCISDVKEYYRSCSCDFLSVRFPFNYMDEYDIFSMLLLPSYRCRNKLPARVLYPPHPQSRNEKKKRAKITFVLSWMYRCLPAHWYGCAKTILRSLIGERGRENTRC